MSIGLQILDALGITKLKVESTHQAARVTGRPQELGTRGSYSLAGLSGIMAAGLAANSEIFQFRWTSATLFMLLRSIKISGGGIAAFAAGHGMFSTTAARSWTVDGGGGVAMTFATHDQKRRTDFATTAAPSGTGVRIATTAALTAGTKVLDTNPFAVNSFGVTATAGATLGNPGVPLWERNTHDEYPFLFEQNEGFVVRATVPATGTWTFGVQVEYAEIDPAAVEGWL